MLGQSSIALWQNETVNNLQIAKITMRDMKPSILELSMLIFLYNNDDNNNNNNNNFFVIVAATVVVIIALLRALKAEH